MKVRDQGSEISHQISRLLDQASEVRDQKSEGAGHPLN